MSEHTPGPWTVGGSRANSGGFVVRGGKRMGGRIAGVVLSEANARLIAAAPELLLALKRAKELLDCWDCGHSKNADCREGNRCPSCLVAEDAEAAIRKATARGAWTMSDQTTGRDWLLRLREVVDAILVHHGPGKCEPVAELEALKSQIAALSKIDESGIGHDDALSSIASHVHEIQVLCDAFGYDPTQWLQDEIAQPDAPKVTPGAHAFVDCSGACRVGCLSPDDHATVANHKQECHRRGCGQPASAACHQQAKQA